MRLHPGGTLHREVDCQGPSHRAPDHAEPVDSQVVEDRDQVIHGAKRHDRRRLGTAEAALVIADDSIAIAERINGSRPHSRVRDSGVQQHNIGPHPDNIEAERYSSRAEHMALSHPRSPHGFKAVWRQRQHHMDR